MFLRSRCHAFYTRIGRYRGVHYADRINSIPRPAEKCDDPVSCRSRIAKAVGAAACTIRMVLFGCIKSKRLDLIVIAARNSDQIFPLTKAEAAPISVESLTNQTSAWTGLATA